MDRNGIADSVLRQGMRRGTRLAGYWFDANLGWGADDLVQEALIRAWGYWPRMRQRHHFSAAVCTILRRIRYQVARRPQSPLGDVASSLDQVVSHQDQPCVRVCGLWVDRDWLASQLDTVLSQLRDLNRKLLMDFHEGFSCAELAVRHGLSLASVKTRLSRARHRVRDELEQLVLREFRGCNPCIAGAEPAA